MKYLVMEIHPAYAVVLDEAGRFLKVANLCYQVGDTVRDVIELRRPQEKKTVLWRPLAGLAAAAACFCLVFFGYYQPNYTAYGTLRIQINPDVEMTVSRTDRVLELKGLNDDGEDLLDGYAYRGKDRETAAAELVERAIHMGYLSDGGTIAITVSSADANWKAREEAEIQLQLEQQYGAAIVIQLGNDPVNFVTPQQTEPPEIVITIPSPVPSGNNTGNRGTGYGANSDGATDYADTDYGPNSDGVTDYADTDYGPNSDGVTDYADTDYGPNSDGVTDYADTDYGPNSDGVTDYADTDYGAYTDGITDYEDRDDSDHDTTDNEDDTDYSGGDDDDDWEDDNDD